MVGIGRMRRVPQQVWTSMERSQQYTQEWDYAGSHRIRHGFYPQAALLLGTEGSLGDANTR